MQSTDSADALAEARMAAKMLAKVPFSLITSAYHMSRAVRLRGPQVLDMRATRLTERRQLVSRATDLAQGQECAATGSRTDARIHVAVGGRFPKKTLQN